MKNFLAVALVLASTLTAAATASAQDHKVQATVPFSFTVGSSTLPAGTYTIGSSMNTSDVLKLSNWEKGVSILTVGRANQSNPKRADVLVFHKYGDQYFLSQIRSDGASMNVDLTPSKAEAKARKQAEDAAGDEQARVVSAPILIALNR